MNTNPVVMEAKSAIHLDRRHVAFDASCFRFDRTGNVRFRRWLVAAQTISDMIRRIHFSNRLVWIMARGTFQLPIGIEVTSASQKPDWLEPDLAQSLN